ncbi:alpha/beta hydrolase [Salmonella enterica subsp. enterica serovar Lexington]|uniref:Hydrolase n=1 Tax=Salmonella enterica subsp. indica TaxID=59207 RepID=A0A379YNE2_SALER|nr:alpha/beta hydrolase [Salmonella enterica]EAA0562678.1 alpha/beta hydrolase [Salmonella enterica subsp. enterica serovar Lexington]EBP3214359.1 alpha/beta hydrolase [Salmonella enterica subsp. arizonae]ECM3796908.1 alpha/beta hydrolase [Salmonella enterica subsp. enterica serovar Newport]EDR2773645.1 alpha/beta hydrolase [Salmonella enterica subsp. enterica serovar Oslo]EDV1075808.1 alpha/beta hydrolase [Salmonella enterica subsp. enterica]EDW0192496.1 alpha/beta hydrolase [Salmonella ente
MSGCEQHCKHHRMALFTASFCFALGYSAPGFTKPDMQPLGPNIVDKGSEYYYFRVNDFDSADGARHYRVWTAVPRKAEPASGYPVLYMLDGNAVMDRLPETLLKQLSGYSPPVIVAVGYQTSLPFDLNGRAYDYTPVLGTVSAGNANNPRFQRKTGGGPEFRQLLETRIAPQVEQGLRINPERRGIWGHSYGGLFVLGSWLSSSFFHQYYSASPSLSRDNFALLNRLTAINPAQYCHKNLIIMEGLASTGDSRQNQMVEILQKIHTTVTTLESKGVNTTYVDYPGLGHGPMFNVSFQRALLDISREPATQKAACL